jgi:two-component system, LytTR family, sensor kinase
LGPSRRNATLDPVATSSKAQDIVTTARGRWTSLAAESFVLLMALATDILDHLWGNGEPHGTEPGHIASLFVTYGLWLLIGLPLTPLVRRFPLQRPHVLARLPLYLGVGVVCNLVHAVVSDLAHLCLTYGKALSANHSNFLYAIVAQRIVFWILVGLKHVALYHRSSWQASLRTAEIEAALATTRMNAARQQVEPSLLFARIEAIRARLDAEPQAADDRVVELGDYLRGKLGAPLPVPTAHPLAQVPAPASAVSTSEPRRGLDWEPELLLFVAYNLIGFGEAVWRSIFFGADLSLDTLGGILRGGLYLAVYLPLGPLLRRYPIEAPHRLRRSLGYALFGVALGTLQAFLFSVVARHVFASESLGSFHWNLSISLTYGQVIFWLFLVFKQVWYYHDAYLEGLRREARLGAQLADAQLHALQMQLHPHFLFNVLHSLSELIHEDRAAAGRMLERLVRFLHLTLDGSQGPRVTVAEELRFLEHYLEIQRVRFQDRLSVEFVRSADALDLLVPTLILQPLVENAIKHGVARRLNGGTIRVSCRRTADRLELRVDDEGTDAAEDASGAAPGTGIGLRNTEQRLRYLYGSGYVLRQERNVAGGMSVRIEIPIAAGLRLGAVA